ncbi:MAG: hypothetical protein JKY54_15515 [Flavobacteriales bacterium]|nr:hypothetical protein [Flavobacteriales bacterium]
MKTRIILLLTSVIFVLSCAEENSQSIPEIINDVTSQIEDVIDMPNQLLEMVMEPFDNVSVDFKTYSYANSAKDIKVASGTVISIPDHAFVDKSGDQVTGKVEIKYREFHTAGEILTSGITMKYDSAGNEMDFQSAGMFEIRGYQNGEEVEIAEGKEINVQMGSFREGSYNFYELEEDGWNYGGCPKAKPNTAKLNQIKEMDALIAEVPKPEQPIAYDPNKFIFDLNVDYNTHAELSVFNGIMWQYAGDDAAHDPEKHPGILGGMRTDVKIIPDIGGTYKIVLTNATKSDSLRCVPVYRGKELSAQNEKFKAKFEDYNRSIFRQLALKEQAGREADILREFGIKAMGIYNYDRQLKMPEAIPVLANFDFGEDYIGKGHLISVFLVLEEANSVIKYPPSQWDLFRFDPNENNKLMAVLPGNKVATFSTKDFNGLDLSQFSMKNPVAFTFKMTVNSESIKTASDVDEVLASL